MFSEWSQETAKKFNIPPTQRPQNHEDVLFRPPSGPLDPGYVQYAAEHWGERKKNGFKTPRHSPTTEV
ncbi:hypothetical protein HUJ04_007971 [Dendroctonus ponderosae]|nr:hypothetical protein HUJ04_007971 [Dendroctonus ponderosae]